MGNIRIIQPSDNFAPDRFNFAPHNYQDMSWLNQTGTAPTTPDDSSCDSGFFDVQSSDLLSAFTTLGTAYIAGSDAVSAAKAGAPKTAPAPVPVKPQTPATPTSSNTTMYVVLSLVGVVALAGAVYLAVKIKKSKNKG